MATVEIPDTNRGRQTAATGSLRFIATDILIPYEGLHMFRDGLLRRLPFLSAFRSLLRGFW